MTDEEFEAKVKALSFWSGKNSMTIEDMATIQPGLARLMPEPAVGQRLDGEGQLHLVGRVVDRLEDVDRWILARDDAENLGPGDGGLGGFGEGGGHRSAAAVVGTTEV